MVDQRSASRAWRAHDDDATHVTDPAPSLRLPRASRLSSAARPPVSSAARLSRYAPCDAQRENYCGTLPGSAETVALREGRRSSRREGIDRSLTLSSPSTHQAAAVNTTTEAKIKVAINGFGRIGTSRARSRIASQSSETS